MFCHLQQTFLGYEILVNLLFSAIKGFCYDEVTFRAQNDDGKGSYRYKLPQFISLPAVAFISLCSLSESTNTFRLGSTPMTYTFIHAVFSLCLSLSLSLNYNIFKCITKTTFTKSLVIFMKTFPLSYYFNIIYLYFSNKKEKKTGKK